MEDATSSGDALINTQILNATPEGNELGVAIENWANGGNPAHRRGARKWLSGSDDYIGFAEEQGAKLAEAASVSPPVNVPTYRGIQLRNKGIDQAEDIYKVGTKFDSEISSFSTSDDIAKSFAGKGKQPMDTSVVLNLESGAEGFNISPISTYVGEKERLFQGRFEVLKVERITLPPEYIGDISPGTILNVDIRQIVNFQREVR